MGDQPSTFWEALEEVRVLRLDPLEPDTFVIIDTHWHSTLEFVVNAHARLEGVYTSDEIPWMIHDYEYNYPGDPELAELIVAESLQRGVPAIASAHCGLPVHYGTLNPMHYYNPGPRKRRVLTISVLDTAEVEPNLRFGEAIVAAVARSSRRAVLIASGGMSHRFWPLAVIRERASPNPADIFSPALREWDERIMAWWAAGDHAAVLESADAFRRSASPEGRFAHYLVLAGAFGRSAWRSRGEQFGRYEAAIGTGQSIFWFPVR
jgi:3,4-dihydroxyphenylacetate 2,3-dioxygenase